MLSPRPGQAFATLHRVSGAARFRPEGEASWLDLGDVVMHKVTAEVSRKAIMRAGRFGCEVSAEESTSAQFTWSFTLQEHIAATLEAQFFAVRGLDIDQPAMDAQAIEVEGVQRGRMYHVEAVDISNVVVAAGTELFREGSDFEVCGITGDVTLLEHGTIPEGSDVTITFDAPVARYNAQVNGSVRKQKLTRKGTLRVIDFDGDTTPKAIAIFECALSPDDLGERSVNDANTFTLRAL